MDITEYNLTPVEKAAKLVRLWKYIMPEPNSGCWLWVGGHGRIDKEYGSFQFASKYPMTAHRASWAIYKGFLPKLPWCLHHKCYTEACVNPDHLEVILRVENTKDGVINGKVGAHYRNKTHCVRGHEYNTTNTYFRANGHRQCRICARDDRRAQVSGFKHKMPTRIFYVDGLKFLIRSILDEEQIDLVIKLKKAGFGAAEIEQLTGISRQNCYFLFGKLGWRRKYKVKSK